MKRFYIFNTGCIRRGLDIIHIHRYLRDNGWLYTSSIKRANLIIIATCGLVKKNENNSLKAIEKVMKRKHYLSTVVITGCLSKQNPEKIDKLGYCAFVPTRQLELLDHIVKPVIPFRDCKKFDSVKEAPQIADYLIARSFCRKSQIYKKLFDRYSMNRKFLKSSVLLWRKVKHIKGILHNYSNKIEPYYNLKIADGCRSNCSFCAGKFAVGDLCSRPLEEILDELRYGLKRGYRIFQLLAEDTGCYGLDIGISLPELLKQIFRIKGNYQLVIPDYNPRWLIKHHEEVRPILVEEQDRIKELFLSVQSGSNYILEQMCREYTIGKVKVILRDIRRRAPSILLRIGLLVGFPGESEKDFEATKKFVEENNFTEVTVNRYEDRPNTLSSKMREKVAQETIEKRVKILEEIGCHIL